MFGFKGFEFDEFVQKAPSGARELLKTLRLRVRARCPDLAEETRFHRVVYGRQTVLRKFLDVRPLPDGVELELRVGPEIPDEGRFQTIREGGWATVAIKSVADLDELLPWIDRAYTTV